MKTPENSLRSEPVQPVGQRRALALLAVTLVLSMTTWFSASAVVPQLQADWGLSTMVTELADQACVGTALTMQTALGFILTVATIWLVPFLKDAFDWRWAFAFLAPGPALGVLAMLRLKSLPEAARIAGGKG